AAAEIRGRVDRAVVDRAADRGGRRRVDVGRAQVDVDLLDQFWIELLVREDRVVAAVVERNAVEGEADSARIEAGDVERGARRSVGVVVLEADARNQVDGIENRLARIGARDDLLSQDDLRLWRRGRLDAADVPGLGPGNDDCLLFEVDRTGGLSENG